MDSVYSDDITEGTNSFGLSALINVVCVWDALICQNKKVFAAAKWYCDGIETIIEALYSDRLNKFTTINVNRYKELIDPENPNGYMKLFEKEIEQACKGIYIDTSDACIDCGETYQVKEVHP